MAQRTATDKTANKRQSDFYQRQKEKKLAKRYFWLDEQSLKKIQEIMDETGLTKDAAINKLIKSGKAK